MIGTAWPSERTRRSLAGFQGSLGSYFIWWYMRTVTRWARERAVEGWPEPAAVVISTESLPRSMALRLAAAAKDMGGPFGFAEGPVIGARGAVIKGDFSRPGAFGRRLGAKPQAGQARDSMTVFQ